MTRHAAVYDLVFEEPPPPLRAVPGTVTERKLRAPRQTAQRYVAPDSHRPHGTRAKYVVEKCRCEPCCDDNREKARDRQRAMRRPDEAWMPYVPAGPARRHIRELMAQGVGPKSIAKLAGVPHGAISKLLYGNYKGRGPSKRIRPATAAKILAVTVEQATGAQKIPAGPTWRLLDDLLARGFTRCWIASEILGHETKSLQIRHDLVRASTARKVEALHRRLEDVAAPPRNTRWGLR